MIPVYSNVNGAFQFAQMVKLLARIIANFPALGMRSYPLHPHAVRLCPTQMQGTTI